MLFLENIAALSVPAVYAVAVFWGIKMGKWYGNDR